MTNREHDALIVGNVNPPSAEDTPSPGPIAGTRNVRETGFIASRPESARTFPQPTAIVQAMRHVGMLYALDNTRNSWVTFSVHFSSP